MNFIHPTNNHSSDVTPASYVSRCLIVLVVLLACPLVTAQQPSPIAQPIQDLSYGDALFYFYSGDYFSSATRLLVAQEQETLVNHSDDADLLLGGLYLSYGQQDQAAKIFSKLLTTTEAKIRDRAWLYLAEIAWQRGNIERAIEALESMGDALEPEFIARQQLLKARLAIDSQNFDQAIAVLSQWEGGDNLAAYAQFNLGVALIRHGRVDEGGKYLNQIGSGKIRAPGQSIWRIPKRLKFWSAKNKTAKEKPDEQRALRDKANLALGFAHLQKDQSAQALEYLSRVSDKSALHTKASLASGWAASELGDYQTALNYWQGLRQGDRLDPAVQEALLAIPFANRHLGDDDQAIAQYQQAIEHFEVEIDHLNEFKSELDHGAFVKALLKDDGAGTVGWFWRLKSIPDSAESRYLYHLVADHSFQEGLKNYRDLNFLKSNLLNWRQSIDVYRNMLDAQQTRFDERMKVQPGEGIDAQLAQLNGRVSETNARLAQIEKDHDTMALIDADQQKSWNRLLDMERRLANINSPKANAARAKHRVLKGLMMWEAEQEYSDRLWQAQKQLKQLEAQVVKGTQLHQSLSSAKLNSPQRFAQFGQRIEDIAPRIDFLLAQVDGQLDHHQSYLANLAGEQFEYHKKRLTSYLAEAQFALATAYDASARAQDTP